MKQGISQLYSLDKAIVFAKFRKGINLEHSFLEFLVFVEFSPFITFVPHWTQKIFPRKFPWALLSDIFYSFWIFLYRYKIIKSFFFKGEEPCNFFKTQIWLVPIELDWIRRSSKHFMEHERIFLPFKRIFSETGPCLSLLVDVAVVWKLLKKDKVFYCTLLYCETKYSHYSHSWFYFYLVSELLNKRVLHSQLRSWFAG